MKLLSVIKRALRFIVKGVPHTQIIRTEARICVLGPNELLAGRNALIVGGTKGIGYAMAQAFLAAGAAHVIITGRRAESNAAACAALAENPAYKGRIHSLELDYCNTEAFESIPARCEQLLQGGKPDILVNNGGVSGKKFTKTDTDDWDRVMNTNLRGVYFLSRVMGLYMKENGIQGNILNVASSSAMYPAPSPYYVSKWGIRAITPGLAKIFIPHGIVVNCLVPGPTATDMLHLSKDNLTAPGLPAGKYTTPEEMAALAVVLVSGMGRSIVGDCVNATGGCGITTIDDANHAGAFRL